MNTFARVALAVLSLSTSPALAECEGNGNPFSFAAAPQTVSGSPFASETWSDAQPRPTGNMDRALALAEPMPSGNESLVQTAGSLPLRFADGMVAHARQRPASAAPIQFAQASRGERVQRR